MDNSDIKTSQMLLKKTASVVYWSEFLTTDPEVRVRGPLSLVSTTEELLGRKRSGSSLESIEYGRRNLSR
jgi:hypothetical protein